MSAKKFCLSTKDAVQLFFRGNNANVLRNTSKEIPGEVQVAECKGHLGVAWQQLATLLAGPSGSQKLKTACSRMNETFNVISILFGKQCNAIAAQRVRRAIQIISLHHKLGYDQQTVKYMLAQFGKNFLRNRKEKPLYAFLGAVMFSWETQKISTNEVDECVNEIQRIRIDDVTKLPREANRVGDKWENVIEQENLTAWRKPIGDSYLYEYKMFGTFHDFPARAFYNAQVDLDYRKSWDKLIHILQVVDNDPTTDCEVIHWVMNYPYPMYQREYVYIRKHNVDHERKVMTVMSHATQYPALPITKNYVRVHIYKSNMVIKPHNSFDENGFDFILTYHDDPQAAFPSAAYNWMASTGVPDFVEKMATSAKKLHALKKQKSSEEEEVSEEDKQHQRIPM